MNNQIESWKQDPSVFANRVGGNFLNVFQQQPTDEDKYFIASFFPSVVNALEVANLTWENIDMKHLAISLVHYAKLRVNGHVKNSVYWTPRYNTKLGLTTLVPIEGVPLLTDLAHKFSYQELVNVKCEIIKEKDTFTVSKAGYSNVGDNYTLEYTTPFDRGDIVGVLAFAEFKNPQYNQLLYLTREEILKKYKPQKASAMFWTKWEEEMLEKTVIKKLLKKIPKNIEKTLSFQASLDYVDQQELSLLDEGETETIKQQANQGELIDVVEQPVVLTENVTVITGENLGSKLADDLSDFIEVTADDVKVPF